MRNPLPVLAAVFLAAAGAFAGDLPTWTAQEEPWGSWRIVNFTDAAGKGHSLWCRWSECGNVKSGSAPLYVVERQSSESYTYYSGFWDWRGSKSSKTSYSTQLSHYTLNLNNPQKAVIAGTSAAFPVYGEDSLTPLGYIIRVMPPLTMANDQPAPTAPVGTPVVRRPPSPTGTGHHTPPPPVNTPAGPTTPAKTKPAVHPGDAAATFPLYPLERAWLTPQERSAYDEATAATLVAAAKKAREAVAKNLRPEASAGYTALLAAGTSVQIEPYLGKIKFYSGSEVELSKDERDALATILKSTTAGGPHSDFSLPNAQLEYDAAMRPILDPATKHPLVSAHVKANQIVKKFREMLPKKPGAGPNDGPPVRLADADLAKLPKADQDAYNSEWAAAKTDDDKRAVNQKYAAKIAALNPGGTASSSFDPSVIKSTTDLLGLTPENQLKFCSMLRSDNPAVGNCGDVMANGMNATDECTKKYPNVVDSSTGSAKSTQVLANRNACIAQINACQPQTAGDKPLTIDSSKLPKALRDYCATLLTNNASTGGNTPNIGTGGVVPSPGSSAPGDDKEKKKDDDKKPDANFYSNLGNGVAMGIFGLLVASFFGGPLLMLGAAVVLGVGGYYASKHIQAPPDDKDKKK